MPHSFIFKLKFEFVYFVLLKLPKAISKAPYEVKLSKIALVSLKMLPNTKIQIFKSSTSNVEI